MEVDMATREEMENVEILEQFAATLRFHGCDDRAEAVERDVNQIRAEVWQRLGAEVAA